MLIGGGSGVTPKWSAALLPAGGESIDNCKTKERHSKSGNGTRADALIVICDSERSDAKHMIARARTSRSVRQIIQLPKYENDLSLKASPPHEFTLL